MSLFKPRYRNDDPKFIAMKEFSNSIRGILSRDEFLSRKQYLGLLEKAKPTFDFIDSLDYENDMLPEWCKKTKSDPSAIEDCRKLYHNLRDEVDRHNKAFVNRHLESDRDYLDLILREDSPNIRLDEDQRKVVLNDEDYTLVIAGAGAGKTTTIEAKAKYLVDRKGIDPKRILIVSFTRKATEELRERFEKIKVPAVISTFHSIGNAILASNEGRHKIVDTGFMFNDLRTYLEEKLTDESFIKKVTLFFASYLDMPWGEEKSVALYKAALANDDLSTMKSDLEDYKQKLVKKRVTMKSEKVRSNQELQIANFLFVNGIYYEYEPVYQYCIPNTTTPYTPDFLLKQGDKKVYLEHFGVNEDGTNWRFSPEEGERYRKHIKDKIALHRRHGTKLIYTFSDYKDGRDLITHLRQLLTENGFKLEQVDRNVIYKQLAKTAENKYFTRLIQLVCNFINRFKTNGYKIDKFTEFLGDARENKDERTYLFLEIAMQCYRHYASSLKEANAIDFQDMINDAAEVLDEKIKRGEKLPYDYIFIDEYQDISFQRFNLADKLSKCSNAKILAVGDDWQSIYRFSGSDITLFTDFERIMGYAQVLYLTNTHRNSQELIDIAGGFIMENSLQKRKSLKSPKHVEDPVIIVSYDDSLPSKEQREADPGKGPYYQMGLAIEKSLSMIEKDKPNADVLLIGRYNFDGKNLNKLSDIFLCTSDNRVRWKKNPKMRIHFSTAHSSKGLGYDEVIVINGKDDILGFPSKIEDDPVMKLVLKEAKEIDYAEERRLFYVALTRTKDRVYLITPKEKPSQFILEIKDGFTNVILNGPALTKNVTADFRYKCPRCGYPLQRRGKWLNRGEKTATMYICSNDPELCGFVTNNPLAGNLSILKCPDCSDGYLIAKKTKREGRFFLGCTNYKADGTGCNRAISPEDFDSSWEKMSRDSKVYVQSKKKLPIEDCILAGMPVMSLLNGIRYTLTTLSKELNFRFNRCSLTNFMTGKKDKLPASYHLDQARGYGFVDPQYVRLLHSLLDALESGGLLVVDPSDRYQCYQTPTARIDEDLARKVFEIFVR